MNQNLIAIAKDNMVRVSPNKLSLIVNSIVNLKVSSAINQLQFSSKRISKSLPMGKKYLKKILCYRGSRSININGKN